jgi:SAM-dependent methyltransferase
MATGSADAFAPLVCPFDLQGFTQPRADTLRCPSGHLFPLLQGMPDLAVVEDRLADLHHRPDRRLFPFPSYHDQRQPRPPSPRRSRQLARVRTLRQLRRTVRFYRRNVPAALARLELERPNPPPAPPVDRFAEIFGPGMYAHELLKRLEKELVWDRVVLSPPVYEIGTSEGLASRYFFAGRPIDFGSEYLLDQLLKSRTDHPIDHRVLLSANAKFLPFPDESLQTILSSETVTCIYASIVSLLAEVNRVLRPGGRFIFTTHGPAYQRGLPLEGWPELGLSADDCVRKNEQRSSYMAHLYTRDEWRQMLAATGFELAESMGIISLELARYSQLFYFAENYGPNVFREPYQRGRLGAVVRLLFGGSRSYRECEAKYRALMQRILAHELARRTDAEFDPYLDLGIVAVKRHPVSPSVARLIPRLAESDGRERGGTASSPAPSRVPSASAD